VGFRKRIKKILFGHKVHEKKNIVAPPVPPSSTPVVKVLKQLVQDGTYPELILYGSDSCPYSHRVQQKIDELNIGSIISFRDASIRSPWREDLLQKTSRTQVPCLFIDGHPLFESKDIIMWFEDNLFE
jgi:glutaredoxin 3